MSAHEQMRMMLDQLMGTARNGDDDPPQPTTTTLQQRDSPTTTTTTTRQQKSQSKIHFTDTRVCRAFLLNCCPHEVLASTRMDLGECDRIHSIALRADYEQAVKLKDYFYDLEAFTTLHQFIADCDRKLTQAQHRLQTQQTQISTEIQLKTIEITQLTEQIQQKLTQVEELGSQGQIEESMSLLGEIEELKKKKSLLEVESRREIPAGLWQQQKLRVCDVCLSYLGCTDNDRRLADHFGGKLHLGFIKIRDTFKQMQTTIEERRRLENVNKRQQQQQEQQERSPPSSSPRQHNRRKSSLSPVDNMRQRHRQRHRSRSRSRSPNNRRHRHSNHRDNYNHNQQRYRQQRDESTGYHGYDVNHRDNNSSRSNNKNKRDKSRD